MRSSLTTQPTPQLRPDAVDPWSRPAASSTRAPHAIGPIVLLLAAFCAVIVFFPPEGRVAGPLHELLGMLFGRVTFMLPLALAIVGVVLVIHGVRPDVKLPRRRITGVLIIAVAVVTSEQLMTQGRDGAGLGTGLVGEWLSASLLDLFGGPLTLVLLVVLLGAGIVLAFDLRWPKPAQPSPNAES